MQPQPKVLFLIVEAFNFTATTVIAYILILIIAKIWPFTDNIR